METNAQSVEEVFGDKYEFSDVCDGVFLWGVARNITAEGGATALSQVRKLKEEVVELEEALMAGNREEAILEAGDVQVVLLQICRLANMDLVECLTGAYDKIKDRRGRMENGIFIKE